jgi:hypothetical protein
VAALADPPTHVPRKIQPLTPADARTLLEVAKTHRQGALVSVGMALGLRLGEALGLQWPDIDLKAGTLMVKRGLERSGGDAATRRQLSAARKALAKRIRAAVPRSAERRALRKEWQSLLKQSRTVATTLHTTELKTEKSARMLSLPPVVVAALKSHHVRQRAEWLAAGCAWPESTFVFCTPIGTPVDPRKCDSRLSRHASRGEARYDPVSRSPAHGGDAPARDGRRSPHHHADPRALPDQPDDEHLHARLAGAADRSCREDEHHSERRLRA